MSDTSTTPTPDYGEPWSAFDFGQCKTRRGAMLAHFFELIAGARNRAIACVNACAGMADPAKDIARLKNCSDELDSILHIIPADAPCIHAETGETVADYILDLQKEVGRVHELYFNVSQQLEAMREAIREAEAALRAWPKAGSGMSTDFNRQSQAFRTGQQALAKLQPFIKP